MLEVSEIVSVPAITLPPVCEVMIDGAPRLVRVHYARRIGQVWLMDAAPVLTAHRAVGGVWYSGVTGRVAPLVRLSEFDSADLVNVKGVI